MDLFIKESLSVFNNQLLVFILLVYLCFATYTDMKYLKIYNVFNISLVITRIIFVFLPVYGMELTLENIAAATLIFLILISIAVILMHKMGGDIKFLTAFMLFFDVQFMVVFMLIASLTNLMYLIILKKYLLFLKNKENPQESNSRVRKKDTIKNKIDYMIIKILVVRYPSIDELINMNEQELKKYKVPFAPFFLITYLVLLAIYYLNA